MLINNPLITYCSSVDLSVEFAWWSLHGHIIDLLENFRAHSMELTALTYVPFNLFGCETCRVHRDDRARVQTLVLEYDW